MEKIIAIDKNLKNIIKKNKNYIFLLFFIYLYNNFYIKIVIKLIFLNCFL